ncbi:MAG: methylenetetrahydrofolate reductase [NAD(P)H] [Oscillospiraceae bacterium]|nr:methylenetetrahydrofolate reductase [NAD(P)H] [Oscillospiraceae bacterium]
MNISQLFKKGKTVFSFEVFPPKKGQSHENIYGVLEKFAVMNPDYISVTCGAGGAGGDDTLEIASFIRNTCKVNAVAHLTCVNSSKEDVKRILNALGEHNVTDVLALRGDINPDIPRCNDFLYASDLTAFIKETGGFGVFGACYPEGHNQAESLNADLKNLKRKVDAGAEILISQLFFDNEIFYSFMEKVRLIGIEVPVCAGIMPVTSKKQIERMVTMCGASMPSKLTKIIARYEDNPEALRDAGIAYATEQIVELISNGVEGIHLYSMNSPYVAEKIYSSVEKLL